MAIDPFGIDPIAKASAKLRAEGANWRALANKTRDASEGHNDTERLMAAGYVIWKILRTERDPDRLVLIGGIAAMIDPERRAP